MSEPKLVKMRRKSDGKGASVHPEEVENYMLGGYVPEGKYVEDDGEKELKDMKVDELKAYAAENEIDLGEAKTKKDIIAAIEAADEDGGDDDDDDDDFE